MYARSFHSKDYRNFRNSIKGSSIESTGTGSEKSLMLILSRDIYAIHTIYTIYTAICQSCISPNITNSKELSSAAQYHFIFYF
jgi:hypothetical protein